MHNWAQKENNLYGHLEILKQYSGLKQNGLAGRLQHGWNPTDGFGFWEGRRFPGKKFVWSNRVAEEFGSNEDVVPIGSPWSYLYQLQKTNLPSNNSVDKVLCIPGHSSAYARLAGDHDDYARCVAKTEGPGADVTVSLFWLDFENPNIRQIYEKYGFKVFTLGKPSLYEGFGFLFEQMKFISSFNRCVSSRLISGFLYASAMGLDCSIYGNPLEIQGESDPHLESMRRWPEIFTDYPSSKIKEFAERELGFDVLRPPLLLRDELSASSLELNLFALRRASVALNRKLFT